MCHAKHFLALCLSVCLSLACCGCGEVEETQGFNPLAANDLLDEVRDLSKPVEWPQLSEPGPVDEDAPEEFTETESGLRYRIRRNSKGRKPRPADAVVVYYRGSLDDGSVFDSCYGRKAPAQFALRSVIAGWTEGLQLVGEGGMIELEIPGELGYGKKGHGNNIPPDATLHFIVEIIKVVR